ncbi:RHS repeat-associated core domain-containing protein, partial [Treponema pedis]|uniref:RHS repeat-associated core domain-containing protein n=1 Tax=Treponema pedis TaxID=409322 RepID=UPI000465F04F
KSAVLNFVFFVMLKNKIEQSAAQSCLRKKLSLSEILTDRAFENRRSRYKELGKKVPQAYRVYVEDTFLPYDAVIARIFSKEETGLYYYGARYLDPKYSRWLSGDPALNDYMAGSSVGQGGIYNTVNFNVYHYGGNNPIKYVDPNGMFLEVNDNGDGTYTVYGGEVNSDKNIYIMKDGKRSGDVIGQMLTEYSFFDDDALVKGAVIDTNDMSGSDFLNDIEKNTPDLFSYMYNARNGEKYDFKDIEKGDRKGNDLNKHRHRGMQLGTDKNGNKLFGTVRDVGNYTAGYVAGKNGLYWGRQDLVLISINL